VCLQRERAAGAGHVQRTQRGGGRLSGFARIARGRAGRAGGVFGVRGWRAVCGGEDPGGWAGGLRVFFVAGACFSGAGAVYTPPLIVSTDSIQGVHVYYVQK
jgi:hypothetical protein